MSIAERIAVVQDNIRKAQANSPLASRNVLLLAVSKTRDADMIIAAQQAGLNDFGENKVQELTEKFEQVPGASWHLIGHLQTNKVKYIIGKTTLIHSLDSIGLASEIEKRSAQANLITDVLIQLNIAEEDTKSGLHVTQLSSFIDEMRAYPHVKVKGLMTIGPNVDDNDKIRPVFAELRDLFIRERKRDCPHCDWQFLSMGMSSDYWIAVEEGANIVRVGSSIFGDRQYI